MNAELSLKLFEIAQKFIKDKSEAKEFVTLVQDVVDDKLSTKEDVFSIKEDILLLKEDVAKYETRISRQIYIVGLVQFLAIVGSVLAIVNFMLK